MPKGEAGFQPRNTPAERRAFFDLDRRLRELPTTETVDTAVADGDAATLAAAKAYTDTTTPLRGGMATSSGVLTTTGTTELTLVAQTLVLAESARVFLSASVGVVQTVAGDIFQVNLKSLTVVTTLAAHQGNQLRWGVAPNGMITLAAGSYDFAVTIQRQTGTGTASVSPGAFCRLSHMILRGATG